MNTVRLRRQQRVLIAGLHLICLALLALYAYVRTLPPTQTPIPTSDSAEAAWWGLWPLTYPPNWVFTVGAVAVVGLICFLWLAELLSWHSDQTGRNTELLPAQPTSGRRFWWLLAISAALVLAFFAFPIVHTRWGDAYILSKSIAWPDPDLRLTHSWQAPLDVFLHSRMWLSGHMTFGWKDAFPVYQWLSPLAGALYLAVILALSRQSGLAPPWLTYGLLASLGVIQLFFGYVENYSFAAAGVLAYLWLGLSVLHGTRPVWIASTVLALTVAAHPSTAILAPSLFYLIWKARRRGQTRNKLLFDLVFQVGLPMLVVLVLTIALMESGGHGIQTLLTSDRPGGSDARWFVPLWEVSTRWEHYTMFSWKHVRDFLNEQLLVAPVVLPSLVLMGSFWILGVAGRALGPDRMVTSIFDIRHPISQRYPAYRSIGLFFLLATALYYLFVWAWNPDYGGQRDWDLFSLATIPATLLLIFGLPRMLANRHYVRMGALPLLLVQALHTSAWIYQNTLHWEWP